MDRLMDFLLSTDTSLLLMANSSHLPWLDAVMIFITSKYSWVPVYVFVGYLVYRKSGWQTLLMLGGAAVLSILLADQLSSGLLKPLVARPRPCQDPLIMDLLHLPKGCSNGFSFVSSHAANFGALAMLFSLYGRNQSRLWIFMSWFSAIVVSYTRVYLGVHFPSDVLAGMMLGAICGAICFVAFRWVHRHFRVTHS